MGPYPGVETPVTSDGPDVLDGDGMEGVGVSAFAEWGRAVA
jgi:hypothetical protein